MRPTCVFGRRALRQSCFNSTSSAALGKVCAPRDVSSAAHCRSDTEKEASALRCALLNRHRTFYAAQETNKSKNGKGKDKTTFRVLSVERSLDTATVEALAGHCKTAVMAQMAYSLDAHELNVRSLVEATNMVWDAMLAKEKMRIASVAPINKNVACLAVRKTRSNFLSSSSHTHSVNPTPFDAVLQRYSAVVATNGPRVPFDVTHGWRVNLPIISAAQRRIMRCVLTQRDGRIRHRAWQLVRDKHLPPQTGINRGDNSGVTSRFSKDKSKMTDKGEVLTNDNRRFSSYLFCRYCSYFGSNTLQRMAFLTDPVMYYVLCNLHLTGCESILEVRKKAEFLISKYNEDTSTT